MKKLLSIILMVTLVLSLTACGSRKDNKPNDNTDTHVNSDTGTAVSGIDDTTDSALEKEPAVQVTPAEIKQAEDGILTIGLANAAIVVNGPSVPMPYRLGELEATGVPEDESRKEIELASGDFFSVNLYLDENEDYIISPAYYNGGDDTVNIADAQAEQITMITYSGEPVDQGVSLFGVPFGMTKSDVLAKLGEPMSDDGDNVQWQVVVSDTDYTGNFTIYFTDDSDSAGASQVDLTLVEE